MTELLLVGPEDDPWGDVVPENLEKGMAGRETAIVSLAMAWAELGAVCTVCVPLSKPVTWEGTSGGAAHFVPVSAAPALAAMRPWDAVITWENMNVVPNVHSETKHVELAVQVAHAQLDCDDEDVSDLVTHVGTLSPWHTEFIEAYDPRMKGKTVVRPNGVHTTRYPEEFVKKGPTADVPTFVYASSPDRGLDHFVEIWPIVRGHLPDAKLLVFYGAYGWAERMKWLHVLQSEMALRVLEVLRMDGVEDRGLVGQGELAAARLASHALAYPCDPMSPTETGCISIIESCAAGRLPIITEADCLESEFAMLSPPYSLPLDHKAFAEGMCEVATRPRSEAETIDLRRFAMNRDWNVLAKTWLADIESGG